MRKRPNDQQFNREIRQPPTHASLMEQLLLRLDVGQKLSERLSRVLYALGWSTIGPEAKKLPKLPQVLVYSWLSAFTVLQKTDVSCTPISVMV